MSRKLYWALGVLIVLFGTAFVFVTIHDRAEIRQLKQEAAAAEKMWADHKKAKQAAQTPMDYTKPPPGKTFANGGHWHNGEWHDGPHGTPIVVDDVPKTEPVPMESVVIEGVGDLKEWLTFFESFPDDLPLEEFQKFREKHRQYYDATRAFDYKNASPEVSAMMRRISEKITKVQTNVFAKKAAVRAEADARRAEWARQNPQPRALFAGSEESTAIFESSAPKGGDE